MADCTSECSTECDAILRLVLEEDKAGCDGILPRFGSLEPQRKTAPTQRVSRGAATLHTKAFDIRGLQDWLRVGDGGEDSHTKRKQEDQPTKIQDDGIDASRMEQQEQDRAAPSFSEQLGDKNDPATPVALALVPWTMLASVSAGAGQTTLITLLSFVWTSPEPLVDPVPLGAHAA